MQGEMATTIFIYCLLIYFIIIYLLFIMFIIFVHIFNFVLK
jgi:hypothetical protein